MVKYLKICGRGRPHVRCFSGAAPERLLRRDARCLRNSKIRARGGIGRHDGFRFHCASVQVQVLSGAPLRNDLWMSGSRAGRARLDSKGLSSFKPVTALLGHGFVFIRHEAPPCGAAMMSGIFRFGFLVRRCPICVIFHIYHHAVAQYHIEKYGKHTADCT